MNARPDPSTRRAEMRAIRWLSLSHAFGIGVFVVLMGLFFWYLQQLEVHQQQQTLYRDITGAQTALRREFRDHQDELVLVAAEWAAHVGRGVPIDKPVADFLAQQPAAVYAAIADVDGRVVYVGRARDVAPLASRAEGARISDPAGRAAFDEAGSTLRPAFSAPFTAASSDMLFELYVPIAGTEGFSGTAIVGYSLNQVLGATLLQTIRDRYQLAIVDREGNTLVSSSLFEIDIAHLTYEVPLDPPGHGVRLRAFAYEQQPHLVDRTLVAAVVGLSLAILASLVALWGHARRRLFAEFERDRLFTLSPDPLCIFETDGALVRGNPAFHQVLGAGERRRRIDRWVHTDDRDRVAIALDQIRRPGASSASFEARFRTQPPLRGDAGGAPAAPSDWRWLHWSLRRDPDAQRPLLYAVARDVTERRNAEIALAAETAYRRAMENSMLTGMRAFDMQGRIGYVNPAFCTMVGFTEEELVGSSPPYPYWPPGSSGTNRENLDHVLAGRTPAAGFEVKVRRKDGSVFDARMYVSPLIDSEGRQTGWMTSMTDVTEPKRIREQLAAAHERFTTVLDELDAAVSVVARAPEGSSGAAHEGAELLFANRMYRSLFGAESRRHETLLEAHAHAGHDGAPAEVFDAELDRWFDLRVRQIRWVDGSPVELLVATDTTRRHAIEEQQHEQDRKLQRTSRLVTMGEMASSLAHELNQPLTAIANYCMGISARVRASAATNRPIAAGDLLEPLAKTSAQAARAGEVIRRIRNFVKRSEPERRHCEVATIVADAVGLAEIDARRAGIQIVTRMPERTPTLYVDPILIEQVLLNLLKNALDAMRDVPPEQRSIVLAVEERCDHLEFSVTDSGAGLGADARARLFEPFFTTKSEGMGIGLNICRSIIESHKGRLWAHTPPGGGCSFRFTLPVDARVAAAVPA